MIEKYIQKFSNLHTDKNRHRWSALTCHRAPHKPFLLLSIMDLIAQGRITDNFITPSFDLVDTFNGYWNLVMPSGARSSMAYPFPRLKTDGFWQRIANPGYDPNKDYNVSSMIRLREIYAGARVDDKLFQYLCDPQAREQLRMALINTYFAPEIRPALVEQGSVNLEAYAYSKELLTEIKQDVLFGKDMEKSRKVRDQGFRKAIVALYDHRCALCGIRMRTPDGHTVVEAAHIKPWSQSKNDHPTNGLALCRLCHWSFDEGLMSVGKEYEVLISKRVQTDQNLLGHILTLSGRNIFAPAEVRFHPDPKNLNWHRHEKFLR